MKPDSAAPYNFLTKYDALPKHVRDYSDTHSDHVHPSELPELATKPTVLEFDEVDRCFAYGVMNKLKTPVLQGLINWMAASKHLTSDSSSV